MRDSLHSYMKVGIVHFMAFPAATSGPALLESIRRIAEDEFFGAIEITSVPAELRAEVAQLLKSSKLIVGYCAQPILLGERLDLNSPDRKLREAAVARMKLAIDEAYLLGASKLAMLSGPAPAQASEAARKDLVDSLSQLCAYARSKGSLGIVLETFDCQIDKRCLVGPTAEAVELALEVRKKSPEFGLMIDLSHLPLLNETSADALGQARPCLMHAHIGNCVLADKSHPAYGDKHPRFGIEGGENDVAQLRQFLKALLNVGYIEAGKQNIVAFEVKPLPGESPEMVIANAKRTLLEAWATL